MEREEGAAPAKVYSSLDQPLCPLCGVDLGMEAVPQLPCTVLTRLGRHFAADCARTRTYLGDPAA